MSEVDRPIKPDQKYLEEYLQRINKVEIRPFLKKGGKDVLPCHINNNPKVVEHKQKKKEAKSKAEIYEEIKQRNLKKFGQKKITVNIQQTPKKINPKKMTINYNRKPHIQTQQYKKKDHIPPQPKSEHLSPQNKEKIEYEKLIEYFNKEVKDLQREKEEFGKVAEKLRFKESIRKEEGLFYSWVKSQVQKRLVKAGSEQGKSQQENIRTNIQSRENPNKISKNTEHFASPKHDNLSKTYSVGDIRNKLNQTCQQMQAIKTQMLHQNLEIKQHKYQIFQAHLLPNFEPQTIYDYIDLTKLKYNGNSYYQAALDAFNSKFEKENKPCDDLCQANQSQQLIKPKIKEKYIGDKRISKYNGWTEVWIAGKQRLMTNSDHYKVIWLSNGDVLQQFTTCIKTYYSKVKDICRIEYKDLPPIYYHEKLKQIWRYLPNNRREVVFENGRVEVVEENS